MVCRRYVMMRCGLKKGAHDRDWGGAGSGWEAQHGEGRTCAGLCLGSAGSDCAPSRSLLLLQRTIGSELTPLQLEAEIRCSSTFKRDKYVIECICKGKRERRCWGGGDR